MTLMIKFNILSVGGGETNKQTNKTTLNLIDTHIRANEIQIRPHVYVCVFLAWRCCCAGAGIEWAPLAAGWGCETLFHSSSPSSASSQSESSTRARIAQPDTHTHRCVSRNLMKQYLKIPSHTHTCLLFSLWLNSGGSSSQFCSLISKGMKLLWSGRPSCRNTHTKLSSEQPYILNIYNIFNILLTI